MSTDVICELYSVCKNTQFGIYVVHVMETDGRRSCHGDRRGWKQEAEYDMFLVHLHIDVVPLMPTPEKKICVFQFKC